jgi:serine protease Do
MKSVVLIRAVATGAWCQTPGTRGRSASGHGPGQGSGYLGVGIVEVTPERAKTLKLAEVSGVEVKRVDDDSPAAKAGLKTDDVILELNGQKVESVLTFIATIGVSVPGSKMPMVVWREGAKRKLLVTIEARPEASLYYRVQPDTSVTMMPPPFEIMAAPNPIVGIEGETLTPQLAQYFGVKDGVLVMTVMPQTPADKAGLKAGDVITKVAGTSVSSIHEISGLVRAARKSVVFTVVRNHKEITLNVELALEFDPWQARPLAVNGGSSSAFSLLP